jgi:pimeloyl-ACP methyl ester carboxylesterase
MAGGGSGMLKRQLGPDLAYHLQAGTAPTLVWLPGFRSDMKGTKAEALAAWAKRKGRGLLRFDYTGHGESAGRFEDGTIGQWRRDALDAIDKLAPAGPLLLIGSSMGGWLALHATIERPARVAGLVLIAPAADFTERLMWPAMSEAARKEIATKGVWMRPSDYEAPIPITANLFEDGRKWLLLDKPVPVSAPVRILQGQQDPDVPWKHALLTAEQIVGADVEITLIKDGDHRLSRPQDMARMFAAIQSVLDTKGDAA